MSTFIRVRRTDVLDRMVLAADNIAALKRIDRTDVFETDEETLVSPQSRVHLKHPLNGVSTIDIAGSPEDVLRAVASPSYVANVNPTFKRVEQTEPTAS